MVNTRVVVTPSAVCRVVAPDTGAGFTVTLYLVVVLPPLKAGADQVTVDVVFPMVALTFVGASGTVAGVTELAHDVTADITGAAGHENFLVGHIFLLIYCTEDRNVNPTLVCETKFINTGNLNSDLFRTMLCHDAAPHDRIPH